MAKANIERRNLLALPVRLTKRAVEGGGEASLISGVGAVYYDAANAATEYLLWETSYERVVERMVPGVFDKAMSRPDDVRGLFNHDPNLVLGRTAAGTMRLKLGATGLEYEIDAPDTTCGRDTVVSLNRGDVTGSSISFTVDEERWTETKDENGKWHALREILSVTLYDVGPVTFPAYEATSAGVGAVGMRTAGEPEEAKRSLESFRKARPPEGAGAAAGAKAVRDREMRLREMRLRLGA